MNVYTQERRSSERSQFPASLFIKSKDCVMARFDYANITRILRITRSRLKLAVAAAAAVFSIIVPAFGQYSMARFISAPEFKLSAEAEAAGIDGRVNLMVTVSSEGKLKSVRIIAGPSWPCGTSPEKVLRDVGEAIKANFMEAKFQPAVKDGIPIEVDLNISYAIPEDYRKLQRQREREAAIARGEPAPIMIRTGRLNEKALSLPKPEYPLQAKAKRIGGTVTVSVLIDAKGNVIQAGTVDGNPLLQSVSRDSACMAKFSPTLQNGQPVQVLGVLVYTFAP